jgi:uncharacterized coiled-coil DUF342 family protein
MELSNHPAVKLDSSISEKCTNIIKSAGVLSSMVVDRDVRINDLVNENKELKEKIADLQTQLKGLVTAKKDITGSKK